MPKHREAYDAAQVVRRPEGRDPASLYLTIAQVAGMRMCTQQTVRLAVHCGRLPAWVVGCYYLIPRAEAEAWALRKTTVITKSGKTKQWREGRMRRLQDAAAVRAIESGDVIRRTDAPPEIPGRCL